jgi:large subunit ribosomal protein L13
MYRHHTGYPGGLKETSARKMLGRKPERILEFAIRGMLPKNTLGRAMGKKLKVYAGPDHPHVAQKPEPLELK